MRAVGAALLVVSACLLGQRAAARRERRVGELTALLNGVHLLETEIVFGRLLLAEALARAGALNPRCRLLFERGARGVAEGRSAAEAWNEALEAWRRSSALAGEDLEPLRRLGGVLGLSSAEDQARHLKLAQRELSLRLDAERERLPQVTRLYRLLGVCGGLALVLLLY